MIKYHGTPITPKEVFYQALKNKNSLVSFANQQDLHKSFEICDKVILDNGAYTTWQNMKKGKIKEINWHKHWDIYYLWLEKLTNRELYFIPDVIDGSEEENDSLLKDNPFNDGVPIWHINESLERLERLASNYNYIAFGSAGEYSELGTPKWNYKMDLAMRVICNKDGIPNVKIHMLRCLNPKIFTKFPFFSGDSTNLAQNHSLYNTIKANRKQKIEPSNDGWKIVMRWIEKYNSPLYYNMSKIVKKPIDQKSLF